MTDGKLDILETAKELVEAWVDQNGVKVDLIVEAAFERGESNAVFGRAMRVIAATERKNFLSDMFDMATSVSEVGYLKPGYPVNTDTELFALLVQGTESEMEKLLSDGVLTDISEQLRASDLAHEKSNIVICPTLIKLDAAGELTPADLRAVTNSFSRRLIDLQFDGIAAEIEELMGMDGNSDAPMPNSFATRLLVGARLLPRTEPGIADLLDLPPLTGDPDFDDIEYEMHDMEFEEAKMFFTQAASDLLAQENRKISLSGPFTWPESLAAAGLACLNMAITIEADFADWGEWDRVDEVHAGMVGDELVIVLKRNGSTIGPVTVPIETGGFGLEGLTDYISSLSDRVIQYEDGMEVLELRREEGMALH